MSVNDPRSPTPLAPDQVPLALERTFLAYERTLMAWIRTSASLITFGFTLYKFFEYLHVREPIEKAQPIFGIRTYGMIMIAVGVLTLVVATLQHWQSMKRLRGQYPPASFSLALLLATLISALGVLALVATFWPE